MFIMIYIKKIMIYIKYAGDYALILLICPQGLGIIYQNHLGFIATIFCKILC